MVADIDAALEDAVSAKRAGADLLEFRIDPLAEEVDLTVEAFAAMIGRLTAAAPLPSIVTCRLAAEGGRFVGDASGAIDRRVGWYRELMRYVSLKGNAGAGPRYIDIEGQSLAASADMAAFAASLNGTQTGVILSSHDFVGRPNDLARRLLSIHDPRGTVAKIAYRARSLRDSLELLDTPAQMDRPTIALGMGEFGLMSRVLAPKFGGFLTFAALAAGLGTAPGQPTIDELFNLYRFRSIGPATKVYGVLGWPVSHSKSPAFHNSAFRAAGHDGVYLPLPVLATEDSETTYASFKATVLELVHHPRLSFSGASVTIPFKEHLVRLAREQRWACAETVTWTGAANTMVVSGEGVRVFNTDWIGFSEPIQEAVGEVKGKGVLVLGAGGAARTAAAWAVSAGAEVRIANRTRDRAERLAADLRDKGEGTGSVAVADWADRDRVASEIVIHATSIGMSTGGAPGGSPMSEQALRTGRPLVFETVYSPRVTPLVAAARDAGCAVIDGLEMFVAQAAAQSEMWVGQRPSMEECRRWIDQ